MLHLTWLDLNSWLVDINGVRILIDPWLVGPMTLGLPAWLLRLDRPRPLPIPENLDLVLLSQGFPDHTHRPSLDCLDRHLPIICPPSALGLVQNLGFKAITVLRPGEHWQYGEQLQLQATVGATLGPWQQENGYIVRDQTSGDSLYYEPHGFPDPQLATLGPVDVVITPMIDISLPLVGPIIAGFSHGLELVNALKPSVIVPTAQAGDLVASGLLTNLIQAPPNQETLATQLQALPNPPQVLALIPGERTTISRPAQISQA